MYLPGLRVEKEQEGWAKARLLKPINSLKREKQDCAGADFPLGICDPVTTNSFIRGLWSSLPRAATVRPGARDQIKT